MKRVMSLEVREDEEEAIAVKEVWTDIILPFLYDMRIGFWADLCAVSRGWMKMVGKISSIVLYGGISIHDEVMKRFGGSIDEGQTIDFGNDKDYEKNYGHEFHPLATRIDWYKVSGLLHLKSLTLSSNIAFRDFDKMVHLTSLTIKIKYFISLNLSKLTTLKHLCINVSPIYSNSLHSMRKWLPLGSKIEYLESNVGSVFKEMGYTGRGKCGKSWCHFEGNWLNGIRHGSGVCRYNNNIFDGVWVMGFVSDGNLECSDYSYKGDVIENQNNHYDLNSVYRSGDGRSVSGNQVYEGSFACGVKHGSGKLYEDDVFVREEEWYYGLLKG
jgi:hypothetical protein